MIALILPARRGCSFVCHGAYLLLSLGPACIAVCVAVLLGSKLQFGFSVSYPETLGLLYNTDLQHLNWRSLL